MSLNDKIKNGVLESDNEFCQYLFDESKKLQANLDELIEYEAKVKKELESCREKLLRLDGAYAKTMADLNDWLKKEESAE